MSLWESLKSAWQAIFSNKTRSFLTMLGIVIGVCAVVLLVSLGQGFQASMTTTFNNMGASALYISSSTDKAVTSIRPLTLDDAEALRDKTVAPSISVVSPTLSSRVTIQYGNNNANVQTTGVTPVITEIRNYQVDQGRFITDQDISARNNVVLLGYQTGTDLFGSENPVGKSVRVQGSKYQVVGTLQKMGGFGGDSYILMPLTTMQSKLTGGGNNVQQIAVKSASADLVDSVISEVTSILRNRHYIRTGAADDFTITDMRETLASMQATLAGFSLFMGAVGAISLIVGGIGIMNIMLVSVTERTREIGIRKAVGAKRRDILLQFLFEAGVLSLVGGAIGITGGCLLSGLISRIETGGITLHTVVSPDIVILAISVSVFVGLASGMYPAMRASRLNPIDALHYG